MIPIGCLIPVTLVYSTLAGIWLTGLKVRSAAGRAMLERHKVALAAVRLLLHDHTLAEMKAMRGDLALGALGPREPDALAQRLLAIESQLRAHLVEADADRTYQLGASFPSEADIQALVSDLAPGTELELQVDQRCAAWPALVRWLFFCHLATLVRNARLHGRARTLRISITEDGGEAVMTVDDDGLGFPDSASGRALSPGGIGLMAAQRDIEEEGGALSVGPAPTGGARIVERLPLA
jgi:nitrate/nitrite-specific signal transduction histidine kinase